MKFKLLNRNKKNQGFTLVEIIITIVIITIGASVMVQPIKLMVDIMVWDRARNNLVDTARSAMDHVIYELGTVRDFQSLRAWNDKIYFTNINDEVRRLWRGDGVTTGARTLYITVNGVGYPLADDIIGMSFTYYDINGTVIPFVANEIPFGDTGRICSIRVNMTLEDENEAILGIGPYSIFTEVAPKNLAREDYR